MKFFTNFNFRWIRSRTFQSQKEGESFNYDRENMRKVSWKLSGSKGKTKAFKILGKRGKVLLLNLRHD